MPRKEPDDSTGGKSEEIGPVSSIGDVVPGKDLEKAAGQIATAAGKSAIRGIANALGAATAEYFAKKAAKAQAVKLAIKTEAEIEKRRTMIRAQHEFELEDIAQTGRVEVAKRALNRMLSELCDQQENLESIGARSIELLEAAPSAKPRELDPEWLFAFSELAQKISDEQVQELWARVLSSAAIEDKTRLSPAALSLLALMDKNIASQFGYFCRVVKSIQNCPRMYSPMFAKILPGTPINLGLLLEIGLIQTSHLLHYNFLDSIMLIESEVELDLREKVQKELSPPLFESYVLSDRGKQIFEAAIADSQDQELSDDELGLIIYFVILDKVAHFGAVHIFNQNCGVKVYRTMKELAGLHGELDTVSPSILKAAVRRLGSNCLVEIA